MFLSVLVDSVAPAGADKPPPVLLYQPDSFPNLRHEPGERECPTGSGGFLELGCLHWSRFTRAEVHCWRDVLVAMIDGSGISATAPYPPIPLRHSPAEPALVKTGAGTHPSFLLPLPLSSRMRGPIPLRHSPAKPALVKTGAGTHPSFLLPTCHPAQPPTWHSKRSAALSPLSFL